MLCINHMCTGLQAVLLCNALPHLTQMLWSECVDDFPAAAALIQVLMADMPHGEQVALLEEMLATGAILRLLMVMSQVLLCPIISANCKDHSEIVQSQID